MATGQQAFALHVGFERTRSIDTIVLKIQQPNVIDVQSVAKENKGMLFRGALKDPYGIVLLVGQLQGVPVFSQLVEIEPGSNSIRFYHDSILHTIGIDTSSRVSSINVFNAYQRAIQSPTDSLTSSWRQLTQLKTKGSSIHQLQVQDSMILVLRQQLLAAKVTYFLQHTDRYAALYLFGYHLLSDNSARMRLGIDSLQRIFQRFSPQLRHTVLGSSIQEELHQLLAVGLSNLAPDFAITTAKGASFQLSTAKGSVVLLCFWNANCAPCIESFPILDSIAALYTPKGLQMISVSIDLQEKTWQKALKRYRLSWPQALDLAKFRLPVGSFDQSLRQLYGIEYIPQYFLIDKEGVIVYHNISSKDDKGFNVLKASIQAALH